MSELSYQLNVARGVTGHDTNTCLLASLDRISEFGEVSPESYERYEQYLEDWRALATVYGELEENPIALRLLYSNAIHPALTDLRREANDVKRQAYAELGVHTMKNVVETRLYPDDNFRSKLGMLANGGFRMAITLDTKNGPHAVGITKIGEDATDDYYLARSTWTPFDDENNVSTDELADKLEQAQRAKTRPTSSSKSAPWPNLFAIPPEAKR